VDYRLEVKSEPGNKTVFSEWVGNQLVYIVNYNERKTLFARVQAKNGAGLIGDWSGWSDGITIIGSDSTENKIAQVTDHEKKLDTKAASGEAAATNDAFSSDSKISEYQNQQTGIEITSDEIPTSFELYQNYPNPFNASTSINYQLSEDSHVFIKIYNARGEEIKNLFDAFQTAGYHTVHWDGTDNFGNTVASGVYIYRMIAGKFNFAQKMAVLR